jgi:flagellar basal-body rod protein FlgB
MQPVNLFQIASQQAQWLSVRQAAVAGNIANVNTPGYRSNDVEPFEKVLSRTGVAMTATQKGHFGEVATEASMPSQNTVVLENELMKAGEVGRTFELNTAIVKAFHRMMLMSVKV